MPNSADQAREIKSTFEGPGVPSGRVRADVAALGHQGHVRETNEDAYVVFQMGRFLERVTSNVSEIELPSRFEESGHVMIVADGIGGHEAGEVASRTALLATLQFILRSPRWALKFDDPATRDTQIREVYAGSKDYLAAVHTALRQRAAQDSRLAGMGTTLTGAYSVGVDLFILHVGDSKAYLVRDGALRQITRDHTVAQEYADMGVISQEEVATHRMHHVLTRAVGGPEQELEGDMHHLRLAHGDRLLLCSDGLTDMASEQEITATLAAHPESAAACQALVELALERGGRDNVTVIVTGYSVE